MLLKIIIISKTIVSVIHAHYHFFVMLCQLLSVEVHIKSHIRKNVLFYVDVRKRVKHTFGYTKMIVESCLFKTEFLLSN